MTTTKFAKNHPRKSKKKRRKKRKFLIGFRNPKNFVKSPPVIKSSLEMLSKISPKKKLLKERARLREGEKER